MTTLKQLLDDIEIDTSDLEDEEEEKISLEDVDLEKIPEEHRPYFQLALDTIENQKNDISKRDLMLEGVKKVLPKKEEKKKEVKEDEKVLGVLDPSDPYAPAFQTLADMVNGLKEEKEVDTEEQFKQNLVSFAEKNPDITRYVKEMDELVDEHPSLLNDIPKLYTLAKNLKGGKQQKKQKTGEGSGISHSNVTHISGEAKTINEAFDMATKQGGNK